MEKIFVFFIVLNCVVLGIGSTAFAEMITKQMYLDKTHMAYC